MQARVSDIDNVAQDIHKLATAPRENIKNAPRNYLVASGCYFPQILTRNFLAQSHNDKNTNPAELRTTCAGSSRSIGDKKHEKYRA